MSRKGKKAFTLIEILVVVSVIIVLMGLTSLGVMGAMKKSKIQKARAEIMNLLTAVKVYQSETGLAPSMIREDYIGSPLSRADVYGSGSTDEIFGPYFEFKENNSSGSLGSRTVVDPWGSDYEYRKAGSTAGLSGSALRAVQNGFHIVYSKGPDTVADNADDIGSWQ